MTNANKVKVSKEVAEALDGLLSVDDSKKARENIIRCHAKSKWRGYKQLNGVSLSTLASALINGYEVEQSEQEDVIEDFKSHLETSQFYNAKKKGSLDILEREQERYSSGYVDGVMEIAKAYGLKIEGVNA